MRFTKELLRDEHKTVGRLDARLTGLETGIGERPEFDPSEAAIRGPYTAMMNTYARESLKFETDREYYALGGGIGQWDWGLGAAGQGYPNTAEPLRQAMTKNPYMKLFVAYGYYDLATPFYAAEYTVRHLGIDASLRANIREAYYEAGHMMYIHKPSLAKLKKDVDGFYEFSLKR
jgi:carboxypeptidase C (cathepsin A)